MQERETKEQQRQENVRWRGGTLQGPSGGGGGDGSSSSCNRGVPTERELAATASLSDTAQFDPEHDVEVELAPDLGFKDVELEESFRRIHSKNQRKMDVQFHIARSVTWAVVGLRMLNDSSAFTHFISSMIVCVGALTTLFPVYAYNIFGDEAMYCVYRPAIVVLDNILQVVLGCLTHGNIYPESASSWESASVYKAAAVYVTGSGFAWLNMSGLLGSLPFRFAWPQQAILTVIMLLASPKICGRSLTLQSAHVHITSGVVKWARAILPDPVVSFVFGEAAVGVVAALSSDYSIHPEEAYNVCIEGQIWVLLIFGFLCPTLILFYQETRQRTYFVKQFLPFGYQRAFLSPEPTLWQYMVFAIPAMLTLYAYVGKLLQ